MLGTFKVSKEYVLANVILLLFSVIALVLLIYILKGLDFLLRGLVPNFINLVIRKLKNMLMFSSVLRYIIESFFSMCLMVVLTFKSPSGLTSLEKAGVVLIAIGLVVFTCLQFVLLVKYRNNLSDE